MIINALKAVLAAGIILFLYTQPGCGQQASSVDAQRTFPELVEKAYGLDQDLMNGVQYYNQHLQCQGHPYFLEDRFAEGSVSVRGRIYKDVRLKYDLHSQHVEIEYENFTGGNNRLITVTDNVDAFSFGTLEFLKLSLGQETARFYQVIRTEVFTCYVYREKKLIPLASSTVFIEQFTTANRTYQMEIGERLNEFNNTRSFAALFPEDQQKEIKRYLRRKHFTFRKATPDAIIRNMSAVSNLLSSGGLP